MAVAAFPVVSWFSVPITKSNVLSESSYETVMFVSVLELTIAPTVSEIVSANVVPANVKAPEISTAPFISIVVAASCISVSATISSCPSALELIYIAASLNCNFSVLLSNMSSENKK